MYFQNVKDVVQNIGEIFILLFSLSLSYSLPKRDKPKMLKKTISSIQWKSFQKHDGPFNRRLDQYWTEKDSINNVEGYYSRVCKKCLS